MWTPLFHIIKTDLIVPMYSQMSLATKREAYVLNQVTFAHSHTHSCSIYMQPCSITHHSHTDSAVVRGNLGFRVLHKDQATNARVDGQPTTSRATASSVLWSDSITRCLLMVLQPKCWAFCADMSVLNGHRL